MKKILLLLLVVLSTSSLFNLAAQPPDPGGGTNPTPNCFPPPCIPIDGGISWLLLAGAAYGGKKLYKANQEQKEEF